MQSIALRGLLLLIIVLALQPLCHAGSDVAFVTDPAKFDYEQRYRLAYELGLELTPIQENQLCDFLVRHPKDDSVGIEGLASIKNNVADVLLRQHDLPATLSRTFYRIMADVEEGPLWREYVVQKVADLCAKTHDTEEQKRGLKFLQEELHDSTGEFSGTALVGLDRIHHTHPDLVPATEIAEASRYILSREELQPNSKTNALQILATYDPVAARASALDYLSDNNASIMLKVSALATLGAVGDLRDVPIIEPFLSAGDPRLKSAATAARRKLSAPRADRNHP